MTGWTQFGALLVVAGVIVLSLGALAVAGLVTLGRRLLAAALDEYSQVRAERRTRREVPPC